ncbi:MAG: phospho-N-acetylmuramoyl-pentapeptide-transferase [Candidatus Eremiobacteraeota bacterium]|nr:phospho-N-acetylmuramoyl-pentapeptide-transferase [Candidatus Eremiobacteraeota bacterium]
MTGLRLFIPAATANTLIFVTSVVETALAGVLLLWVLRRMQLRQHAYEDAPESHQRKSGTPTMGGLMFLVPLLTLLIVHGTADPLLSALILAIVACAGIGCFDDALSILRGRNLGLRARTKFLATALVAITFLRWAGDSTQMFPRDTLFHAGAYALVVPHWLWLLLGIIAITGTIHAVNLTDGLDGLATGTVLPPLVVLLIVAGPIAGGVTWVLLAGIGACLAFLLFNLHPAKLFMGDTGSLALGALLSGAAILTGEMLLLVLIGGVFVAEALSVIVQVAYFKRSGGKRIFRMSPLHHHFELGGWSETKVTVRFWLVSAILSAVGLAIVR